MKITSIKVNHVRFPVEEPIVNAPPMPTMQRDFLAVRVMTDEGIEGIGATGFGGRMLPALKLAVEIDGSSHDGEDAEEYDLIRQRTIEALGIHFIRFKNAEVLNNPAGVIQSLCERIESLDAGRPHPPAPSPSQGEGEEWG